MKEKNSCLCIFHRKMKEKDRESIREISTKIMKSYRKSVFSSEKIVGFDDLPVYIQCENILKAEGRTIRIYYTE